MEGSVTNRFDVLIAVVYSVVAWILVFMLKQPLSSLLTKNKVKVTLPGLSEIEITPADAGGKISAILTEFKDRYESLLNDYQKDLYRRIESSEAPVSVKDLIPDFHRSNPDHIGALRALRGIGLVVPDKKGPWNEASAVVVTKFGREISAFLSRSL